MADVVPFYFKDLKDFKDLKYYRHFKHDIKK